MLNADAPPAPPARHADPSRRPRPRRPHHPRPAAWTRWLLAAAALGAVPVLVIGCVARLPDGEVCESDDECKSEVCLSGICRGSFCREDDGCNDGWRCVYYPPNEVDDFLNDVGDYFTGNDDPADGVNMCTATCGSCATNQHCEGGGSDLCVFGAPTPVVTLDPVGEMARGETVVLQGHGEIEAGSIISWQWDVSDVTADGTGFETVTLVTDTATLPYAWHGMGSFSVTLTATSSAKAQGSTTIGVNVCGITGDGCYQYGCCGGSCNDGMCL